MIILVGSTKGGRSCAENCSRFLHKSVVFQNVTDRKRPISAKIRNPYRQDADHKGTKKQWPSVLGLTGRWNNPSLAHRGYTILQIFCA